MRWWGSMLVVGRGQRGPVVDDDRQSIPSGEVVDGTVWCLCQTNSASFSWSEGLYLWEQLYPCLTIWQPATPNDIWRVYGEFKLSEETVIDLSYSLIGRREIMCAWLWVCIVLCTNIHKNLTSTETSHHIFQLPVFTTLYVIHTSIHT